MGQASEVCTSTLSIVPVVLGTVAVQSHHTTPSFRRKGNTCRRACPSAGSAASAQALHPWWPAAPGQGAAGLPKAVASVLVGRQLVPLVLPDAPALMQ
jgi:hypothetical protein